MTRSMQKVGLSLESKDVMLLNALAESLHAKKNEVVSQALRMYADYCYMAEMNERIHSLQDGTAHILTEDEFEATRRD